MVLRPLRGLRLVSVQSLPQKPPFECDFMPPQQRDKLILEAHLPMVLLLIPNILENFFFIRRAHRKRPIPRLPGKTTMTLRDSAKPSRRIRLHHAHTLRDGQIGRQSHEHMHVVFGSVDQPRYAANFPDDAAHIRKKLRPRSGAKPGDPMAHAMGYDVSRASRATDRACCDPFP